MKKFVRLLNYENACKLVDFVNRKHKTDYANIVPGGIAIETTMEKNLVGIVAFLDSLDVRYEMSDMPPYKVNEQIASTFRESINIDIFKRNVQLFRLGVSDLDGLEKVIYAFLIENLSELNKYTLDERPGNLYFGKSRDSIVLYYDSKKEYLTIKYYGIYSFFKADLRIDMDDIDSIILWWVNTTLNIKETKLNITYDEVPLSI